MLGQALSTSSRSNRSLKRRCVLHIMEMCTNWRGKKLCGKSRAAATYLAHRLAEQIGRWFFDRSRSARISCCCNRIRRIGRQNVSGMGGAKWTKFKMAVMKVESRQSPNFQILGRLDLRSHIIGLPHSNKLTNRPPWCWCK